MKIHVLLSCVAIALSACAGPMATSEHGTKIAESDLAFIKKGVTSRSEIEARLGSPNTMAVVGEGKRIAMYQHYRTSAPAIGFGPQRMDMSQSSLQIIYTAAGTVEDYEFTSSDKAYEVSNWSGMKEIKK